MDLVKVDGTPGPPHGMSGPGSCQLELEQRSSRIHRILQNASAFDDAYRFIRSTAHLEREEFQGLIGTDQQLAARALVEKQSRAVLFVPETGR